MFKMYQQAMIHNTNNNNESHTNNEDNIVMDNVVAIENILTSMHCIT